MEGIKLIIKGILSNVIFTGLLIYVAGNIAFYQAWIYLFSTVLCTVLNYFSIKKNVELIKERAHPGMEIKNWDKVLLFFSFLLYLLILVVAALDSGRFNPLFRWDVSVVGFVLMCFGQILFFVARSSNQFFSSVARIQKERGHFVCDQGLYKIIRHPGYLGMIITLTSIPCITNSIWSVIPTVLSISLLIVRTILEDKMLRVELDGYEEYTLKTKYKLVPLIW